MIQFDTSNTIAYFRRIVVLLICVAGFSGCGDTEAKVELPENPTLPPKNATLMTSEQTSIPSDAPANEQQQ